MKIVFRVDASARIGTGHVMRCLSLADALAQQGATCEFVCRAGVGNLADRIAASGHSVLSLPDSTVGRDQGSFREFSANSTKDICAQDAVETLAVVEACDWLVVDHYALGQEWEVTLRSAARRIMVIDDLADRAHDCDLLLDQNIARNVTDYVSLVPESARCLIGPKFALIRPEFSEWREYSLARRRESSLRCVLVSMGGIDADNVTGQILAGLSTLDLPEDVRVLVVMGIHAPAVDEVRTQAMTLTFPCEVRVDVDCIAKLIADCDIAIGAAGSSSWERCALAIPSIVVAIAANQQPIASGLEAAGAAIALSAPGVWTNAELESAMRRLSCRDFRSKLSQSAQDLVDGLGVERVVEEMVRQT